jgi:biotin-independent malonate decarboxylase gamma subunit
MLGQVWFDALSVPAAGEPQAHGSLRTGSTEIHTDMGTETAALLAVVPDPAARFPRARHGEVGLSEGWAFAEAVSNLVSTDSTRVRRRPIVIVIDVASQAYGYVEELAGIHQALAAAANAVASARLAGHPVIGFIVGQAISGAFLATGLQANRLVALDHDGVAVQVMSEQATARITRRTIAELDEAARSVPATAFDIRSFASLGALHALVPVTAPAAPTEADVNVAAAALASAITDARSGPRDLSSRLDSDEARSGRAASRRVRELVAARWEL